MNKINMDIRNFFYELIDLVNKQDLPWEVRRIVLENVLNMTEKRADDEIRYEAREEEECKKSIQE